MRGRGYCRKLHENVTRMHSSRMRTVRNSSHLLRGVSTCFRGLPAPGGFCSRGVSALEGCLFQAGACSWGGIPACTEADPPVDRQTRVKT